MLADLQERHGEHFPILVLNKLNSFQCRSEHCTLHLLFPSKTIKNVNQFPRSELSILDQIDNGMKNTNWIKLIHELQNRSAKIYDKYRKIWTYREEFQKNSGSWEAKMGLDLGENQIDWLWSKANHRYWAANSILQYLEVEKWGNYLLESDSTLIV